MKLIPRRPTFPRRQRIVQGNTTTKRTTWDYANSNLIIWLLTAVVGGAITFTYTNQQACLKEADLKLQRIDDSQSEILSRVRVFVVALQASSNYEEFRSVMAMKPGQALKDKSFVDVTRDLSNALVGIEPAIITGDNYAKLLSAASIDMAELNNLLFGLESSDSVSNEVLQALRPLSVKLAKLYDEINALKDKWRFQSRCGLLHSFSYLWSTNRATVEVVPRTEAIHAFLTEPALSEQIKNLKPAVKSKKSK